MVDYIVDSMIRKNYIESDDRDIYFCGLNTIIHTVTYSIFILIFMLVTGWVREILSVLLTTMIIRAYSGGYHASTYRKCLILSVTMLVLGVLMGKGLMQFKFWGETTMVVFVISAAILLLEGTLPSLVRLHSKEYLKKKEKEYRVLLIGFSIVFIFVFYKYKIQECIYISMSMLLIVFALLYEKGRRRKNERESSKGV